MTRKMRTRWNLRRVMADRGMYQTSDIVGPLAERGIHLSREQVYRLVTGEPQRLSMDTLAALCDILDCTPNDLMEVVLESRQVRKTGTANAGGEGPAVSDLRPVRARIKRPPKS
ncbi:helix-turn-helix domain-containing protein [Actinomarinicola tropica]|uniref:Helix-turn-helix domain-containing protein n=1 Tax=Actinomarinicola tropica TaxID=2789776 RepID=A0A5Q2RM51_9ACTN|nr:helix-turn-helix transcriptional regulator [Actinomarinicola tropica]QGG94940.1 helix-turn-helix domain-containing protein [Actinomarinicola tropica]